MVAVLRRSAKAKIRTDRYKDIFKGETGEWVLRDILKQGHVFQPTYVAGDPMETAHREGMRRLALSIARQVNMTDDQLEEMQRRLYTEEEDYG